MLKNLNSHNTLHVRNLKHKIACIHSTLHGLDYELDNEQSTSITRIQNHIGTTPIWTNGHKFCLETVESSDLKYVPRLYKFFKLFHIFPHFIHLSYISNNTISNIACCSAHQPSFRWSHVYFEYYMPRFLNNLSYSIFLGYLMHWQLEYQDWSISWPVLTKIIIICWTFNRKLGLFKAFLLSKYIYLTDSWPRRKRKPIKAKL